MCNVSGVSRFFRKGFVCLFCVTGCEFGDGFVCVTGLGWGYVWQVLLDAAGYFLLYAHGQCSIFLNFILLSLQIIINKNIYIYILIHAIL